MASATPIFYALNLSIIVDFKGVFAPYFFMRKNATQAPPIYVQNATLDFPKQSTIITEPKMKGGMLMIMFESYNANPINNHVGDCTVRAISKALGQDWEKTYVDLAMEGLYLCDMPSANHVWGSYLRKKGFKRDIIPDTCPDCYTVRNFCEEHPNGTFILALINHVIAVINGHYYDTWDSGNEIPVYYWHREEAK